MTAIPSDGGVQQGSLRRFFVATFALTWAAWFMAAAGRGTPFGIGGPVFLIGVFAPMIVAVSVTAREAGVDGVIGLVRPVGFARVRLRWYAFALAYMPVLKL